MLELSTVQCTVGYCKGQRTTEQVSSALLQLQARGGAKATYSNIDVSVRNQSSPAGMKKNQVPTNVKPSFSPGSADMEKKHTTEQPQIVSSPWQQRGESPRCHVWRSARAPLSRDLSSSQSESPAVLETPAPAERSARR